MGSVFGSLLDRFRVRRKGRSTRHRAAGVPDVRVRSRGGWTLEIPAPVALVGAASVLMAIGLAAVDPVAVRAAAVERQAEAVLRWESGERARLGRILEDVDGNLRDLRRQALLRGIAPEGDLAPTTCEGLPEDHLGGHLAEVARLSAALAAAGPGTDELPARSPIDLSRGNYGITQDTWLPEAVHVSSTQGTRRDPFTGKTRSHRGLDISAPIGTPVIAPAGGVVLFAGSVDPNVDHARSLLGKYVLLRHGDTGYVSLYAHLSKIEVKRGEKVSAGQEIGAVGTTGRSTAPHLHYQIMKDGEALNPLRFITDVVLVRDGESVFYARPFRAEGSRSGREG